MYSIQFIFLIVVISVINGQLPTLISNERLPGLDQLESGFNIISVASTSDQESKFRIFNLTEKGLYPFRLKIGNVDRIYNTPLQGQVTRIGVRRDINCESIATNFQQFYSNYFRSTRTTSGWSFLFFSETTKTHETLKQIYEAMTKSSQAVGTSTSWWGLYSIQLGPPDSLTLDPLFNNSMLSLVKRVSNPKTEADQSLYNMFIETYGTHYVSHVIMGAVAHVYTFMNESYSKTSSYEEMTREVSKIGFYLFFGSADGSSTHSILQNTTESFRKNSNSVAVYQPPVPQTIGKTEWQSWLTNAPENPVVVNRTVAPISNIFYEYPKVQSHLRLTIDYYMKNGALPAFAQLNNP